MIRRLLHRLHKWVWEYDQDINANDAMRAEKINRIHTNTRLAVSEEEILPSIRFSVITARGGVIVTSRTYDRQKDRSNEIIHVIHDDEDVAKRVGEIVAMELMKA